MKLFLKRKCHILILFTVCFSIPGLKATQHLLERAQARTAKEIAWFISHFACLFHHLTCIVAVYVNRAKYNIVLLRVGVSVGVAFATIPGVSALLLLYVPPLRFEAEVACRFL